MLDDITKRVLNVQKKFGLSNANFAEKLDIQRSSISHLKSGRNKASVDIIQRLLMSFPEINADWLMRGKGDMLKESNDDLFEEEEEASKNKDTKVSHDDQPNEQHSVNHQDDTHTEKSTSVHTNTENTSSKQSAFEFDTVSQIMAQQNTVNPTKQVVRVIIFYSDKTFSDFRPE